MKNEEKPKMAKVKRMTNKQLRLAKEISENTVEPVGKLLLRAGYSKSTSQSPQHILKALPFRDLFSTKISDKLILKAHKKLLTAKVRTRTFVNGKKKTEIVTEDAFALSKGVDLAYRVKGAFAPTESKLTITGLEAKTDDEIDEMLQDEQNAVSRARRFKVANKRPKPRVIEGEIVQH